MPTIVFVGHRDWGLFNYRMSLAEALRREGCDVVFVCPDGEFVGEFRRAGYPWLEWKLDRGSFNAASELAALVRLVRIYKRVRPDAAHHFHLKPCVYGSIAAMRTGVRPVVNLLPGLGYVFSRRLKATVVRAGLRPLLRWALSGGGVTVFLNADDRDQFVQQRLMERSRTAVVPDSVDTRLFGPPSTQNGNGHRRAPVVLMASRLLWDKGIGEFVRAAEDLRSRGVQAEYWVAGEADPGNPKCVPEKILAGWRKAGAVKFLGLRLDMPELLRQVDVVVLPSYHEGMGRILLEAGATELPVVATDLPGCREVVHHGVNGFLVPPRDARAVAEALRRLIGDSELRRRMGTTSRRLVEGRFDDATVIEQYMRIYRGLGVLGASRRAPHEDCGPSRGIVLSDSKGCDAVRQITWRNDD